MAVDVSALGKRRDLVTRDLLGGSVTRPAPAPAKELDLDLQIPSGWERRLDLLSGEMYLKKSHPDPIHDLNLPPPPPPPGPVDLKLLLSPAAPAPRPSDHQCTLDKVKSALERAGRWSGSRIPRSDGSPSPSSPPTAASADGSDSPGNLTAAGCSKCLMYVLVSEKNPRCQRCDSHVLVRPAAVKRRKVQPAESMIDLNLNSSWEWR
ncbi:uncharacterized protein M6B38_321585 [Iris pallida]|uniref:GIR1-like zinc ribbon domain-containing protein n=1 Tax=Iris pallida TaxID=29817 RepID=A0AAX6HBE8_IRIPA|nr:uncharacterized protein M6B38_321585 [Iris pallida]